MPVSLAKFDRRSEFDREPMIHRLYKLLFLIWRPRRWQMLRVEFDLQGDESILDAGGTAYFWQQLPVGPRKLVIANLNVESLQTQGCSNISTVVADACALPFSDWQFDIAFSNSVIEHVGSWSRQVAFANEMRRVGRRVWVQTPAREFPVEPHLLGPPVHWLPTTWRGFVARWFSIRGWLDSKEAVALARPDAIRLLTRREMQTLFPDCVIRVERFLGIPKSYIAIRKG